MFDPGGWGGGGQLNLNHACVFVSKSEGNRFFFRLQVNEMNEKVSFKMGVKFAASFYMGKNFLDVWHVFILKYQK